jgi:hypothetical protein
MVALVALLVLDEALAQAAFGTTAIPLGLLWCCSY